MSFVTGDGEGCISVPGPRKPLVKLKKQAVLCKETNIVHFSMCFPHMEKEMERNPMEFVISAIGMRFVIATYVGKVTMGITITLKVFFMHYKI
jgi:hypothetical protein